MCLILLAYDVHPRYRLIVAANRDEYYDRPTAPLSWWQDHPEVLAGRDLRSGGTWMGVTRGGRFAAVTNYREPGGRDPDALSRGRLVLGFLTSNVDAPDYLASLRTEEDAYNGFSLVAGDAG
ncbi:MAG: NRDE family protein, partial [bacterium]|nr:NRDE family protein [bacterium]